MKAYEIKQGIYWVGAKDWNLRDFHGYKTSRGSTYNAYLIIDDKITLVDAVKGYLNDELFSRIASIIDPAKIDYIVCNHVEMDHSGSLPELMKIAKNAEIITNNSGKKGLEEHYDASDWKFKVVKTGDEISLGKRTLSFVTIPMLHWPDSMMTYLKEDKILMPNDAFGQHYASEFLFADEAPYEIVIEEAKKYFANILYPYSKKLAKLVEGFDLDVDIIAPSHGLMWRGDDISAILNEYKNWAGGKNKGKAVVVYDTMWGATEKMADCVKATFENEGVEVIKRSLKLNDISDVITDIVDAKYVVFGSPCLNSGILPTMGWMLTYLKGLAPTDKIGFCFGSYGWKNGFSKEIQNAMSDLEWKLPKEPFEAKYRTCNFADLEAVVKDVIAFGKNV
ncbi:MAG: FprA family A-type flavoprotein [Alphaproteobacteria bacterium]